jgi:uncharacterized protein YbcC (UPF0753/DUF2309 family)
MKVHDGGLLQSRHGGLMAAAEAAAHAIPPAFPLAATVAVNPFLGQSGEDFASAASRLARIAGIRLLPDGRHTEQRLAGGEITDEDLAAALDAFTSPLRPASVAALRASLAKDGTAPTALPTMATLAGGATGTDWNAVFARSFGLWAAGYFDRGQALWLPKPWQGAYAAWRTWAANDLTPEIAGLKGFCAHVDKAPDSSERAIVRAADRLGIGEEAASGVFHRLLLDLGGWAQHARYLLWQAELEGETDKTLIDLLAIRLVWEEALLAHAPEVAERWSEVVATHAVPLTPSTDIVTATILQDAAERAYQRRLAARLTAPGIASADRPALQAAFCIDVRSEVLRRSLESLDPAIETLGFAGFFGLPLAHRAAGTDVLDSHLPVLMTPTLTCSSHAAGPTEATSRISRRATRAWGRFRQAAVSSFAFVEAAGLGYGAKLVSSGLGLRSQGRPADPMPRLDAPLSADAKADLAARVLKAMSLTGGFARVVLLVGHGTHVTNNPHESAYQCGACGGYSGEVSARILAGLLNDPDTREKLAGKGIAVPEDTHFVAGLHVTTTDVIELFDDAPSPPHVEDLAKIRSWLTAAGRIARTERAARLPGATANTVARRALNWAELRPEWGLAGCAAFIAAPRASTRGSDLGGRSFLHSYDWRADDGFKTLELILTAPVVVASWISLQYYGSTVAPEVFGAGDKLLHNVVGGLGVVEGNGGTLRTGLPLQAIHDGTGFVHEPLRLSVLIDAPTAAITEILTRHPPVRELFDNGWLHLLALDGSSITARYRPGLLWKSEYANETAGGS